MRRRAFLLAPLGDGSRARARADVDYPAVATGTDARVPARPWQPSRVSHRVVVRHGLGARRAGRDLGVQITFFRNRPGVAEAGASRFAPRQLLFAHAAIADPRCGRLRHDQRAARAGFGLAEADAKPRPTSHRTTGRCACDGDATPRASPRAISRSTSRSRPTRRRCCRATRGVSRKGPRPAQASYYYSRPQLATAGTVTVDGRAAPWTGRAWLDHEWSSEYLAPEARGWDWTGINFDDGGALMAFRIRDRDGAAYWAGGALRDARGDVRAFAPGDVAFTPLRHWRSPRTGVEYPVAFRVDAGGIDVDARAADGRPGARRARERGHDLLGRRGARARQRSRNRPRVSRADRLRQRAQALNRRARCARVGGAVDAPVPIR